MKYTIQHWLITVGVLRSIVSHTLVTRPRKRENCLSSSCESCDALSRDSEGGEGDVCVCVMGGLLRCCVTLFPEWVSRWRTSVHTHIHVCIQHTHKTDSCTTRSLSCQCYCQCVSWLAGRPRSVPSSTCHIHTCTVTTTRQSRCGWGGAFRSGRGHYRHHLFFCVFTLTSCWVYIFRGHMTWPWVVPSSPAVPPSDLECQSVFTAERWPMNQLRLLSFLVHISQ